MARCPGRSGYDLTSSTSKCPPNHAKASTSRDSRHAQTHAEPTHISIRRPPVTTHTVYSGRHSPKRLGNGPYRRVLSTADAHGDKTWQGACVHVCWTHARITRRLAACCSRLVARHATAADAAESAAKAPSALFLTITVRSLRSYLHFQPCRTKQHTRVSARGWRLQLKWAGRPPAVARTGRS